MDFDDFRGDTDHHLAPNIFRMIFHHNEAGPIFHMCVYTSLINHRIAWQEYIVQSNNNVYNMPYMFVPDPRKIPITMTQNGKRKSCLAGA